VDGLGEFTGVVWGSSRCIVTFVVVWPMEAGVVPMMTGPVNGTVGDTEPRLVGVACIEEKEVLVDGGPDGGVAYREGDFFWKFSEDELDSAGKLNPAGGEPRDPALIVPDGFPRESLGGIGMGSCVFDRGRTLDAEVGVTLLGIVVGSLISNLVT
jgi:hypothetical protein